MGWCIGILLLIVGFVLFMIPGSQTIGWILGGLVVLWVRGVVIKENERSTKEGRQQHARKKKKNAPNKRRGD